MNSNKNTIRSNKALKAYVDTYYEDNYFLKKEPDLFFKLWLLIKTNKKDWLNELIFNSEYSDVNKWINSLFLDEGKGQNLVLYTEDKVKLILNNITKLPDDCKCHLKSLNATVNI